MRPSARGRQQTGRRDHGAQQHGRQTVPHGRHVNAVDQGIAKSTGFRRRRFPIRPGHKRARVPPTERADARHARLPRHNPPMNVASNTPSDTAWNRSPVAATGTRRFHRRARNNRCREQQQQQGRKRRDAHRGRTYFSRNSGRMCRSNRFWVTLRDIDSSHSSSMRKYRAPSGGHLVAHVQQLPHVRIESRLD